LLAPASELDLVSVIIPTYNRANLIGYAPGTLDAQTWPRQEIVVVEEAPLIKRSKSCRL
jgi:hypothetical protein